MGTVTHQAESWESFTPWPGGRLDGEFRVQSTGLVLDRRECGLALERCFEWGSLSTRLRLVEEVVVAEEPSLEAVIV